LTLTNLHLSIQSLPEGRSAKHALPTRKTRSDASSEAKTTLLRKNQSSALIFTQGFKILSKLKLS